MCLFSFTTRRHRKRCRRAVRTGATSSRTWSSWPPGEPHTLIAPLSPFPSLGCALALLEFLSDTLSSLCESFGQLRTFVSFHFVFSVLRLFSVLSPCRKWLITVSLRW